MLQWVACSIEFIIEDAIIFIISRELLDENYHNNQGLYGYYDNVSCGLVLDYVVNYECEGRGTC